MTTVLSVSSIPATAAENPFPTPGANSPIFNPAEPFYQAPAEIPAQPGTVIRSEIAPHALNLADSTAAYLGLPTPNLPGKAHRILYSSTAPSGAPAVVSGVVIEPLTPWRGEGPTPTLVMGPGTRGEGRACAPSLGPGMLAAIDPQNDSVAVNYELPLMYAAVAQGMRVVMTDHMGMGTEGQQRYLNNQPEAYAMLDAARATLAFAGVEPTSPIAFYGYSQGGGSAAAAAEYAAEYAPELNVKGTYAGAPTSGLIETMEAFDRTLLSGLQTYLVAGAVEDNPQAYEAFLGYLNEQGRAAVENGLNACAVDSVVTQGFRDSRNWTTTGESFTEIAQRDPIIREFYEAQERGHRNLNAPMLVINDDADDIVPVGQARRMAQDYCALGGDVEFRAEGTPAILTGTGINHGIPMYLRAPESFSWIKDRFNGAPTTSNCGAF
ncbi:MULTISPECIES: alpha/beta fold hydrolase [unclassified Corynebacterium]|uniref:alpha/beta fold hydrolase n=1 Tax=unclassified Corynebacterium TaxID=2624378 RepID=UPI0029CA4FB7|nr:MULTISPECIES: alpha/beta fold hydrolase [unclassified Corynebacterium]WPF66576.1 alpha/beta fold hydrolase [Corynebacterium sp. 22KM0430]WPF69065.1 alpha/beta fold hydrolase [Corynebacterium sp. 21KM1197]